MGKRAVSSAIKSAVGEEEDSEHGLLAAVVSNVAGSLNIDGLSTRVGEVLAAKIAGLVTEQGIAEEILAEHGEKLTIFICLWVGRARTAQAKINQKNPETF